MGEYEVKNCSYFVLFILRFSWIPQILPWIYANWHNTASNWWRIDDLGSY